MTARLTDQQLADIAECARVDIRMLGASEVTAMIEEIRERRAADLTAEEVGALVTLRDVLVANTECGRFTGTQRALAVLERLLNAKGLGAMRCKHRDAYPRIWQGYWTESSVPIPVDEIPDVADAVICTCGTWLPLGPATDTPETAIELRAVTLADAWRGDGGVSHIITEDEARGWEGWPYRQPTNDGEWTGFLACQIRMHERDLGDVNWAGHHMADHPIDAQHGGG